MSDRVSVIIPAYNAAAFIRTSVGAALAQTHQNLEVIVVDDGSTDATASLAESIVDPRLRVIRQSNKGQSAALNRGARDSTGDYVKLLDADDWLNPQHVKSQLRAISGAIEHVASCRWGYFRHSPEISLVRDEATNRDYDNPVDWIVDSLTLDGGMMGGWMWLIPRTVWAKSGGWDERLSLNNDFDFTMRLLLASRGVKFAADATYAYREGVHGALSASGGRKAMESAGNTTESGCNALLAREDSPRTRKVCADRWQRWQYAFFPEYPDLSSRAGKEISRLGGSALPMEGGLLLHAMLPVIGWKNVRRLQARVHSGAWSSILERKAEKRMGRIESGTE